MFRLLPLLVVLLAGCGKPDGHPTSFGPGEPFDPLAYGPREAPPNAPMPRPELLDHGPQGDGLGVNAVGQVHLRFTQPVVPLGTDTETDALRVTANGASVKGRAYWQSPDHLVFESAGTLSPATRYEVIWDGTQDLPEVAWSFETERPSVELVQPANGSNQVATDVPLALATTIPTTAAQLQPRLKLTIDGRPGKATVRPASDELRDRFGLQKDMLFEVDHAPFPVDANVRVNVEEGWRSTKGSLPASTDYRGTFKTHPKFSVTAVTCWKATGECPIQPLDIELSTQIAEGQERYVTVRPRPPELKVEVYYDELQVDGRFVPGTTYTLEIDEKMTDVFGQKLGSDTTVKLDFEMPPPEVYLTQRHGAVLDDGVPHVGISSRHVRRVRVRAAKVGVDTYRELHFAGRWNLDKIPPLEELGEIVEKTIDVRLRKPTNWASTPIDFEALVGSHRGPVAIEVTGLDPVEDYEEVAGLGDRGLFHFGSLGPHVLVSTVQSVLRVEDLDGREPVVAEVSLLGPSGEQKLGSTDAHGLLKFDGRPADRPTRELVVVRARDGDLAVLPLRREPPDRTATWLAPGETIQSKLVTERGVYRPGDDVYVTGWAAVSTPHRPSGHRSLPPGVRVRFELVDWEGLVVDRQVTASRDGRFSTKLTLPTSARLGHVSVHATYERDNVVARDSVQVSASVKEFRTPDFEVNTTADPTRLIGTQPVTIDVESRYYSGSLAEIREVRATRSCWTTAPPYVDGWELGVEQTWAGTARMPLQPAAAGRGRATFTDTPTPGSSGKTRRCDYSVTVQNPSFQEEGAGEQLIVHPTPLYLGMAWWDASPRAGDPLDVRFALFDVEGQPSDAPPELVDVEIIRTERQPVYSHRGDNAWVSDYQDKEVDKITCRVRANGRERCGPDRLVAGSYEIRAVSRADKQRRFERSIWVHERWQGDEKPTVEITTSTDVLPTDKMTAVSVKTRHKHGLLVVERFGIIEAVPFQTRRGEATVRLTPQASWAPGVTVTAYAIEYAERAPRIVSAQAKLDFDASDRELTVNVSAPEQATVRDEIEVTLDASGNAGPISGMAAVWVVDDAILDLTNYRLPDLVRAFYPRFVQDIGVLDELHATLPAFVPQRWDPYTAVMSGSGFGGRGLGHGGSGIGRAGAPSPRADFRATPFFEGHVAVVDGRAAVSFKLPDNITRFRILAVVSAADAPGGPPVRFGSGESTIDVSAPLIVRPALPRFLRPGDAPRLAAVVQNTTEKAGTLAVRFSLEGDAVQWQPSVEPQVERLLPAAGETRIGFDARVVSPGTSHLTVRARFAPADGSPAFEDAVQLPLLSASEPTLTQTVAMYGTLDDDGAIGIPVRLPDDVEPDVGGVSITLTSTLLGGLRDATRNLITYPYGCAEQTSSRMLPLVALSALSGFVETTEIPDGRTIEEFVDDGIGRLLTMQQPDGGFGYWPSSTSSSAYVSAYVTWILWLAKQRGHQVPDTAMTKALDYLENLVKTPDLDLPDSVIYFADLRRAIAVYTLAEADRRPVETIDRLIERGDRLPVFARAFTIAALARVAPEDPRLDDELRRLTNKITETSASASVVETPRYDLGAYFHSDLRSSAIAMMALTRAAPNHAVIVKLARGLMEKRYKGAWRNTQENAYALVALADYARHFEREEPNFEVKVWVDNAVLIDDRWAGRSSKSRTGTIPMQQLTTLAARNADHTLPLNVRRRGLGRAYYRLAMTYAPSAPELPAIARGIEVQRTFRRDAKPPTDGPPEVLRAGEVIAVDVTVHSKALLRYVAVDVPVPAGLEPIDLSLGSRKTLPMGGTHGWWTSHVEHHDDRVVMFADVLQPGDHTRTVYLRATTAGTFSFPPTHAEAMYTPEVFGRSVGSVLRVKE